MAISKEIKSKIIELGFDKVTFRQNGEIVVKEGYFYHHGRTAEKFAEFAKEEIKKVVPNIEIKECNDEWRAWPKDSYLVAVLFIQS